MDALYSEGGELGSLDQRELAQIVSLWKRTSRELVTRFTGTSMVPTIKSASEVVLKCDATAAVGDVIAYCLGEQLIVHRVIARSDDGEWLVARGDAAALPDPLVVPRDAVAGMITAVQRDGTLCPTGGPPRSPALTSLVDRICRVMVKRQFLCRRVLPRMLRGVRRLRALGARFHR